MAFPPRLRTTIANRPPTGRHHTMERPSDVGGTVCRYGSASRTLWGNRHFGEGCSLSRGPSSLLATSSASGQRRPADLSLSASHLEHALGDSLHGITIVPEGTITSPKGYKAGSV